MPGSKSGRIAKFGITRLGFWQGISFLNEFIETRVVSTAASRSCMTEVSNLIHLWGPRNPSMTIPSVDPDVVKSEKHGAIGVVIQRDVGEIVRRWALRAVAEQPSAASLHRAALQNHLPLLLWEIGRCLAESAPEPSNGHHLPAIQHGEQRWEVGWSLEEVVRDYQILRLVLIDYLEETVERPLRSREVMAIGLFLDEAIRGSISMYLRTEERSSHATDVVADIAATKTPTRDAELPANDFLSVLAHETRNSLAPVLQALQVLELSATDLDKVKWATELMRRQVRKMTRLVDDLLDVARLSSGNLSLRQERVDLVELMRSTSEDMRPGFEEKEISFTVMVPDQPVYSDVDGVRIAQATTNILHNALKFTPPGGAVTLAAQFEEENRRFVVKVRDSGAGIELDSIDSIFERYRCLDVTAASGQDGLGLGLALVKGLIECHGGRIRASSLGPGTGATFEFWIPAIEALPEIEMGDADASAPRRSFRVLVIEDNVDAAQSLSVLLTTVGHEAAIATNGEEGLRRALDWRPDVVLCDIGLPGVSGELIASQIRDVIPTEEMLLLAVSGYAGEPSRQRALAAGFDDYLVKPIDLERIEQCLRDWLARLSSGETELN